MEVHIEPFGITAMPHTRLLRLAGAWPALAVDVLRQADVGYAGGILTDQMDMGIEDGGVHWLAVFTQHCGDRNVQVCCSYPDLVAASNSRSRSKLTETLHFTCLVSR